MKLHELQKQKSPPTFRIGPDWLRDLFQYGKSPGVLPVGCQITVTGSPGVGKTRFGLQMLNAIAQLNPQMNTVFCTYEASGSMLKDMVDSLGVQNIGSFHVDRTKDPHFDTDTITLIDSVDWWAQERYRADYPPVEMANFLATLKEAGCTVILIHHKTKTGNKQSGSTKFLQLTDTLVELTSHKRGISVSTPSKNRYPGPQQLKELIHTAKGLEPAPPGAGEIFMNSIVNFFAKV